MEMRRVACVVVLIAFATIGWSEGRSKTPGFNLFPRNDDCFRINQHMWQQIRTRCSPVFVEITGTFKAFGLYFSEDMVSGLKAMSSGPHSIARVNLQSLFNILPPQSKQNLVNCLQKEYIPFCISQEKYGSSHWVIRYLESFFSWPDASRRYLGDSSFHGTAPARAPASSLTSSAPVQSPSYAPEPSLSSAPASSSELRSEPPADAPRTHFSLHNTKSKKKPQADAPRTHFSPQDTKSKKKPRANAPKTHFSPKDTNSRKKPPADAPKTHFSPKDTNSRKKPPAEAPRTHFSPKDTNSRKKPPAEAPKTHLSPPDTSSKKKPSAGEHSSGNIDSTPHPQSNNHHNNHTQVAVAIGVTAAGTFIFALVLVCCYCKANKRNSEVAQKDDGALLSLSLGEISPDSSQKPSLGGKFDTKFGSLSSGTNPNQNGKFSSLAEGAGAPVSSDDVSAASSKFGASVPPSPPLKPPPGRSDPPTLPPSGGASPSPPGPPPPPTAPRRTSGPPPPPPPNGAKPHRPPQPFSKNSKTPPPPPNQRERPDSEDGSDAPKTKLKPFFWDKVTANPDQSMVWHQINAGSFQFDEDMMQNLFGCANTNRKKNDHKRGSPAADPSRQYIQIIEPKKAQNISILLRALNVTTEEVRDALYEGHELPTELLQTLVKMAPTADEELKLRLYNGEVSQLGPAERFVKVLVDIPFAFKRMDSLLFKNSLQEEISGLKETLATLEVASNELRNSRLFLKLLEAVLKTGNRMNTGTFRGDARAFKLDTLLKLSDVKGTDGKTTLLHFVVQEIIRSEGKRAARLASKSQSTTSQESNDLVQDSSQENENYFCTLGLEVVSGLSAELENVRKAAVLDSDAITSAVSKLGHWLVRTKNFLDSDMNSTDEESEFHQWLKTFVDQAEAEIMGLLQEEKRITSLVKSTVDYFHGSAGKDDGLRLFVIVRDFLIMLDKACKEVKKTIKLVPLHTNRESPTVPATDASKAPSPDLSQKLFPAISDRRMDYSSSDDESSSP